MNYNNMRWAKFEILSIWSFKSQLAKWNSPDVSSKKEDKHKIKSIKVESIKIFDYSSCYALIICATVSTSSPKHLNGSFNSLLVASGWVHSERFSCWQNVTAYASAQSCWLETQGCRKCVGVCICMRATPIGREKERAPHERRVIVICLFPWESWELACGGWKGHIRAVDESLRSALQRNNFLHLFLPL